MKPKPEWMVEVHVDGLEDRPRHEPYETLWGFDSIDNAVIGAVHAVQKMIHQSDELEGYSTDDVSIVIQSNEESLMDEPFNENGDFAVVIELTYAETIDWTISILSAMRAAREAEERNRP